MPLVGQALAAVYGRKKRQSVSDGEKERAGEREALNCGGQLHCITPFQPITLCMGAFFLPLLHGNYFPAQRQLQATSATASGPTALAGHCIIYLCAGSWMDTPNPPRHRGLSMSPRALREAFGLTLGKAQAESGSRAKWCLGVRGDMRGSSSQVCNIFRNGSEVLGAALSYARVNCIGCMVTQWMTV